MTQQNRRSFLADTGMGMTGMALSAMLYRDGIAKGTPVEIGPDGQPHIPPTAKSVIWIFLIGGLSHLESFDVKPALNKYAGKTIAETPWGDEVLDKKTINKILLDPSKQVRKVFKSLMALQTGYKQYGESGRTVSDWFPHIGGVIDHCCVARSMYTIDNNHGAQLTFHTGRKITEGAYPTIGSWVSYGLGSANNNLPDFVVLGSPSADCCGAAYTHGASYLGPEYAGVRIKVDPKKALPFVTPADTEMSAEEQADTFSLIDELNRHAGVEYPDDPRLRARIRSYELAFNMQAEAPEVMDLKQESAHIQKLYGTDVKETKVFGERCLAARRLVERGVRFVQVFHGHTGSAGAWDSHTNIKANHARLSKQVDKPIAGLIADLKQRGLLDETLVVVGTEFGRTPGFDLRDRKVGTGRDHHPHGFSVVMAGGGVKEGIAYGKTDELGFHAVEDRHYVTDIHATVLHCMGLDSHYLEVPGRKRLDMDHGRVMKKILKVNG